MRGLEVAAMIMLSAVVSASVATVFSSRPASADGVAATDSVPRRIAYNGTLEFDGRPYNGTAELRFSVFDGATAATAAWTEEYLGSNAVAVYEGAFEVQLGSLASNLDAIVAGADDLYLAVAVRDADGIWVELAGRQRFTPAPFALWAVRGSDFAVNRDLSVARNADIVGTLRGRGATTLDSTLNVTGATTLAGATTLNGATSINNTLTTSSTASVGTNLTVNGTSTLRGNTAVTGTLSSTGNASFGTTNVSGSFSTTGGATIGGGLGISGTDVTLNEVAGRGGGRALVNWESDVLALNFGNDFTGGVQVQGAGLDVLGYLQASDCSICVYWSDSNDTGSRRYTCAALNGVGATSPAINLGGTVNADDRLRIQFRCDGVGSASGDW